MPLADAPTRFTFVVLFVRLFYYVYRVIYSSQLEERCYATTLYIPHLIPNK